MPTFVLENSFQFARVRVIHPQELSNLNLIKTPDFLHISDVYRTAQVQKMTCLPASLKKNDLHYSTLGYNTGYNKMYLSLVKSVSLLEFYQLCFMKYFKNAVYGMSYYTLASIASPKKPMFGHIARRVVN